MDTNTKVIVGSVIATLVIIIGAVAFFGSSPTPPDGTEPQAIPDELLIRDASYNVQGPTTAPVTIVEFSDLQCPACKAFSPVLKGLLDKYPEDVRLIYRHFPLPQHPLARPAALATEAAGQQGKFWEYHDMVFENQESLSDSSWEEFATQLELNITQFNEYRNSDEAQNTLQTDLGVARQVGVTGTPTIFLNGYKVESRNIQDISAVIDGIIAQSGGQPATDSAQMEDGQSTPSAETSPAAE